MTDRQRRIAENETRFREINERLNADLHRLPVDAGQTGFVCECGRSDCSQIVSLTRDEYERVRADPLTFAIVPGHEFDEAEDVVVREERFFVVRKHPETAPIAERTDPRRSG